MVTFLSDGTLLWSRTPTVITGPTTYALVSTGHGEWVRTGNREFTFNVILLSSDTTSEFTALIKFSGSIKLNRASDEFSLTGTVAGFDPAGNPLFSFPTPISSGKRIAARP